jgi:hypothetical protein
MSSTGGMRTGREKQKFFEKNLPHYHFAHLKFHKDYTGTETKPPCWQLSTCIIAKHLEFLQA